MNILFRHTISNPFARYSALSSHINVLRNFSCLTIERRKNFPNENIHHHVHISRRNASFDSVVVKFWTTLSNSTPVAYMQEGLVQIHDFTGLPWWASIIFSTFLFRTVVTLPLAVYQNKITSRLENLTLEMPAIVEELKKETAFAMKKYNWTQQQARQIYNRSLKKQWNNLIVRDNCHPAKTLIVLWGQIPLWIFQSVAIRNLVYMLPDPNLLQTKLIFTELTIGGFGWIPNLTEVDSSYILPIVLGLVNLSIIQMQSALRTRPPTRLQRYVTNAFRVLSVEMIPIASSVPSALCLYWVSSSVYGLIQNLILISPRVKRLIGIPLTKSEIQNPYERLTESFKKQIGLSDSNSKSGSAS